MGITDALLDSSREVVRNIEKNLNRIGVGTGTGEALETDTALGSSVFETNATVTIGTAEGLTILSADIGTSDYTGDIKEVGSYFAQAGTGTHLFNRFSVDMTKGSETVTVEIYNATNIQEET